MLPFASLAMLCGVLSRPSLPPPGSPSDATQSPSFVNLATRELI